MFLGVSAAALAAPSAHADGVTEQQQQVKNDLAEIQRLEQKSSQLNEQYLGYMNDKVTLEAEIAAGETTIAAQSAQVVAMQEQLAAIAVAQFTGGGVDAFALFGNTASATDGLQRQQLVRSAVNAGAVDADTYDTQLDQLKQAQNALTAKQNRVAKLAGQAAATLDATQQAGQAYQAELSKDQAKLGVLLEQEQQRQLQQAAADHAASVASAKAAQDTAARDQAARDQAAQDTAARDVAARQQASADGSAAAAATASDQGAAGSGTVADVSGAKTSHTSPASPTGKSTSTPTTAPPLIVHPTPTPTVPAGDPTPAPTVPAGDPTSGAPSDTSSGDNPSSGSGNAGNAPGAGSDASQLVAAAISTSTGSDSPPPVSSRAQIAVAAAKSQLGVRYQFAMSSPGVAFDCSGLTAYAWAQAGVSLPHQSAQQYASTPHIPLADLQPGDLLVYYSPISHVALYIGNGQVIQAPAPGKFVEIVGVDWSKVVGASRPG